MMLTNLTHKIFRNFRKPLSSQTKAVLLTLSVIATTYGLTPEYAHSLYFGTGDNADFVLRWHYQYFCDHTFDPRRICPTPSDRPKTFDPKAVKPGDTIFVRNADKFFQEMHPQIEHPYIIVSAGEVSDRMLNRYKKYLDKENIIAWFGVHPTELIMKHPKFHPLPLGVAQWQRFYTDREKLHAQFRELRSTKKEFLVYVNFKVYGKERTNVHNLFANKAYCKYAGRQKFDAYINEMAQCCFALSPEGAGPDCYRTWEALLVGSIPVVKQSCLDPLFKELPVLIVNSWEEAANEDFLKNAYQRITSQRYDIQKLYANFWTNKIKEVQNKFRKTLKNQA